MIFGIDFDGVVCNTTKDHKYEDAMPFFDMIKTVNCLYDCGHTIIIHTARGMASGGNYKEITEKQLKEWGVKYHQLIMTKPNCDFYVDDKAMRPDEFLEEYKCSLCDGEAE
jgi:hypothetical protein